MTDAKDLVAFTKTPERNEADITILLEKYDEIIGEVKNYENTVKSLKNDQHSVKRSNSALGHILMTEYHQNTGNHGKLLYRAKVQKHSSFNSSFKGYIVNHSDFDNMNAKGAIESNVFEGLSFA